MKKEQKNQLITMENFLEKDENTNKIENQKRRQVTNG